MRLVWPTRSAPWCSARQTYLFEWPVPLGTDSSGMSDPLLAGTHRRVEEVTNWPYLDMMEAWWTPPLTPVHETSKKAQITGRHFMILWIQSSSLFGASPPTRKFSVKIKTKTKTRALIGWFGIHAGKPKKSFSFKK